jgi:hypothetical protein
MVWLAWERVVVVVWRVVRRWLHSRYSSPQLAEEVQCGSMVALVWLAVLES